MTFTSSGWFWAYPTPVVRIKTMPGQTGVDREKLGSRKPDFGVACVKAYLGRSVRWKYEGVETELEACWLLCYPFGEPPLARSSDTCGALGSYDSELQCRYGYLRGHISGRQG